MTDKKEKPKPHHKKQRLYICVDFDGTCVTHEYPDIGREIGAAFVLKRLVEHGHRIILHTMRSGLGLEAAVGWFRYHDIPLYGVNENLSQKTWTDSRKVHGNIYIDDAALGCPLIYDKETDQAYVNWNEVEYLLMMRGLFESAPTTNIRTNECPKICVQEDE